MRLQVKIGAYLRGIVQENIVHGDIIRTEMFGTLAAVERSVADLRGLEAGRLQLAVSTTGEYFAPRVLAAFVKQHPKVEVSLQIHNRGALLERMAKNLDDLYIFAGAPAGKDVVTYPLLPNPIVPFAHADHALAREKNIPFRRFAAEPFLMREPGSGARGIAREIFEAHGCEPRVRMELSNNEAIKQAIIAGLGVSIMSRYTLGLDVPHEQLATERRSHASSKLPMAQTESIEPVETLEADLPLDYLNVIARHVFSH